MLTTWLYKKYKARRARKANPEAAAAAAAAEDPVAKAERKRALMNRIILGVALAIPVFLETLDYTVVATSQPHIASSFNRLDLQSYIGTVYLLTSTVFLPLFASLADIYGRHWALQCSLLFFLGGSALSTGSKNMPMMLAGRGIAGVGAAGMLTVVRVVLADSTSLDDNNWQGSILVILYSLGFSVGPTIGGALTTVTFRWVFAINLPCAVVSMILIFVLLRKRTKGPQASRRAKHTSGPATDEAEPTASTSNSPTGIEKPRLVDWVGATCFISGGILLLLGLNWGSEDSWSTPRTIVSLVIGAILIVCCLFWEWLLERAQLATSGSSSSSYNGEAKSGKTVGRVWRRALEADPMIPLAVLKSYDVCATQLAAFTAGMVMLVIFYFIAIFMVIVNGLSAIQAGVQLVYFAPGLGIGTITAIIMIKLKKIRQPKYPISLGNLLIVVSLGLISWAINGHSQAKVNVFMALAGVGVGMTFGPLAIHARFSQPSERVAIVVALNLFFRTLGGTVGLAQCATIMNSKVRSQLTSLGASSSSTAHLSAISLGSLQQINNLPPEIRSAIKKAFRNGVRWSFISLIPWCALSFFACLFLSNIPDTDRAKEKQKVDDGSVEKKDGEGSGDTSTVATEKVATEKPEVTHEERQESPV
ncbi:MFS general substrate transporter [Rickenella mellea]|uniref:MFS general substrate transporter n=1 Tax=Rickenella mellea TaxID=50990 RepID=A0A4Y7PK15_9AGAM|nr:MFS general substrate transporter [Rickenella mellea]